MAKNNKDLMCVKERYNKRGELRFELHCSGKDPNTGKGKVYIKTFPVPRELTGKKEIEAYRLQCQIEYDKEIKNISKGITIKAKDCTYLKFIDVAKEWVETILVRKKTGFTHYRDCKGRLKFFEEQLGKYYLREITKPIILKFCYWLNNRTYKKTKITVIESLRSRINEQNISLKKFAEKCNIAHNTLILALTVGCNIDKEVVEKICKCLGLQPNEYFKIEIIEQSYSWASNNSMKIMLNSILKYAVTNEYIDINYAAITDTKFVTGTKGKKSIIDNAQDIAEFSRCISMEPDIRKKVAFSIFINLGMRCCEVVGLEWKDISFDKAELNIQRNTLYVLGFGIVTKETKTVKSERVISIPSGLLELLKEYKEWWDNEKINHGDLWKDTDRLFCQDNGKNMAGPTVAEWLRQFEIKNNLKQITPHGLRHTNITMLLKNGVDIKTIATRVGHSSPEMIFKVYGHFTSEADKKAANIIDNIVNVI